MALDDALRQDLEFFYEGRIFPPIEERIRAVRKVAKKRVWTQKDGTEIHVTKMADSHLENTIRFLKRKNSVIWEPWIEVFETEQRRRK